MLLEIEHTNNSFNQRNEQSLTCIRGAIQLHSVDDQFKHTTEETTKISEQYNIYRLSTHYLAILIFLPSKTLQKKTFKPFNFFLNMLV